MKEISLGVYNERVVFKMNRPLLQEDKEVASSCMADIVVEETPLETFGISYDIFNYRTPLCLKYEQEVNSDESDESEGSFWEDSDDDDDPTLEPRDNQEGPIKVTMVRHCCEPKAIMKDGKKLTMPS